MIGVAVLISMGLLLWGINYLKGVNLFKPANYYSVKYSQVSGLTASAPVTINGFQVGLVRDVAYDYDNNGKIIVELSLDKELKLPVGTEAMVVTDMLGTSTIALKLSDSTDYYEVGAEIPGTVQAGLMDNVSKDVLPALAVMMPKIDSILTSINTILANPALNASVSRIDKITANLEQTTDVLNRTMAKNMPEIMSNANALTNDLTVVSGNLAEVSDELKKLPLDSTIMSMQLWLI